MKCLLAISLAALTLFAARCAAQDYASAKEALRSVSESLPPDFSSRLIEVVGDEGATQPAKWRFVATDPVARGGIQVAEVRGGRLTKLSTPSGRLLGGGAIPTVNLDRIRIDSPEAFRVANQEASRHRVGFDAADYALRVDAFTGKPVWVLTLVTASNRGVGSIFVSADSGTVVRVENLRPTQTPEPSSSASSGSSNSKYEFERSEPFFYKFGNAFERASGFFEEKGRGIGGSLQEFFTGRRTIDRKYQNSEVSSKE